MLPGQNNSHVQSTGFEKFCDIFWGYKGPIWLKDILFVDLSSVPMKIFS